jgi:LysR family transcriptional regulator, transcription activator of glutamate synthase operon
MELRQLRYLVALADERSFTRAAAREHVAQPALSQQIRRLEDELGLPLVDRTTRRVALTGAGKLLTERARRVIAEVEAARAELGELAGIRTGRVTIGAMQTLGPFDLPRLLATFHARYPEIELSVREEASDTLAEMVRADAVDLALLSVTDRIDRQGLELHELAREDLIALLPARHPLADRGRVRVAELAGEDFISFREGWAMRHLLTQAAREAGFEPRVAFESNETTRIRALVERGLGVALLARSAAADGDSGVRVVAISDPRPSRDVTLAWRAGRRLSPPAGALLELARGAAARAGDPR